MKYIKSLSRKIAVATLLSIIACVIVYSLLVPFVLNYTRENTYYFWTKMVFILTFLSPLSTISIYMVIRPIIRTLRLIDSGVLTDRTHNNRAALSIVAVSRSIYSIGVAAYLVGTAISFFTDYYLGRELHAEELICGPIIAIQWGVLNALVTSKIISIALIEARIKLNATALYFPVGSARRSSVFQKLFIPVVMTSIFLVTFSMIIFYNHSKNSLLAYQTGLVEKYEKGEMTRNYLDDLSAKIENYNYFNFLRVAGISIFLLMIVVVLFYVFLIEVQSHIDKLSKQISILAEGDADISRRIPIISQDDIGVMTGKINQAIERLYLYNEELSNAKRDLEKKVEERTNELNIALKTQYELNNSLIDSSRELDEVNRLLKHNAEELEHKNRQLLHMATTDMLTGLYNKNELNTILKEEVSRFNRYGEKRGYAFSLLFIDMDDFKFYNDKFGHAAGDQILILFADLLKSISRPSDFLFRFGGDEFVIILANTSKDEAVVYVKKLYEGLEFKNYFIPDLEKFLNRELNTRELVRIGFSCGISQFETGMDEEMVLNNADNLLYEAKGKGKNRYASV